MISLISKNRTELMGIGTIAVFCLHILVISEIPFESIKRLISIPVNWVYTEGFLFLSGFGVYFSLNKEFKLTTFYKKRAKRVYFPFLIIAGPFLTFITFLNGDGWGIWIARITTLNFWIEGNFCSMWYISVILLMYFLSPLFFTLMKGKKGFLNWCVLFILSLVIIEYVKKDLLSDTEFLHYQWITQVPAYLLGMLVGKLKEINQNVVTASIFCIILAIPVISTFLTIINKFLFLPSILSRLSYLVLFSYLFTYLKNINNNATKTILVVLQYLGKYSLELYMLHMLLYGFFKTLYLIPPTANILLSIVIALLFCSIAQKASSKVIQCISTKI